MIDNPINPSSEEQEENRSTGTTVADNSPSRSDKWKTFLLSWWQIFSSILSQPDNEAIHLNLAQSCSFLIVYFLILFLYLQSAPRAIFAWQVKLETGMLQPAFLSLLILATQYMIYAGMLFLKDKKLHAPHDVLARANKAMLPMYILFLLAILCSMFHFLTALFISIFALSAYVTSLCRMSKRDSYYGELCSRMILTCLVGGLLFYACYHLLRTSTFTGLGISIPTFSDLLK